jgi:hypothetical protein
VGPTADAEAHVGGEVVVIVTAVTAVTAVLLAGLVLVELVALVDAEARAPERLTEAGWASLDAATRMVDAPERCPAIPTGKIDDPTARLPPILMGSDTQLIFSLISPLHCWHMAITSPPSIPRRRRRASRVVVTRPQPVEPWGPDLPTRPYARTGVTPLSSSSCQTMCGHHNRARYERPPPLTTRACPRPNDPTLPRHR